MQVNVNKINSILEGSFKKREESEDSIVLQTITEEIVDKKTARGTKFQKTASPATRHISGKIYFQLTLLFILFEHALSINLFHCCQCHRRLAKQ